MDDLDKRIRRSAIKLVAVGVAIGFLIGLAVGATVAYNSIERTVIVPLGQSIKT
jgi:ABC-type nitrate/sulfonate/bicarbonate transport system permease component